MATRKFLTSVADVYGYDNTDTIVFTGKTLLDSSIEVSLGSAPVRGGRGNQLQYIYYHTGEMKFTLTDTQWNLAMLAATVGSSQDSGYFYDEETVTVTASSGTVVGTPLAFTGTTIYGWATSPLGVTQRVTFSTKTFTVTGAETAGSWCVRYYAANTTSGKSFTISANMIPSVVKLVMETQLNSADVTTNKIGIVQIIAPTVTLSGAFTLSMKADGVANTPLTATALAYTGTAGADACATTPYYAKIVEIIDSTYWYSDVVGLAIEGGNFHLHQGATGTLPVWAIPTSGAAFRVPSTVADFDFTSGTTAVATVQANAPYVYGVTGGTSLLTVKGTTGTGSLIDVETSCTVTVVVP
jgi:hypothetical protein